MIDDDEVDPSDWLAQQFGEETTERPPRRERDAVPPVPPVAPPPAAVPPLAAPPAAVPPVSQVPPPAAPAAPPPSAEGGFSWGLTPGGGAAIPPEPPQPAQPAQPAPPSLPAPPVFPPQQALPPAAVPPPAFDAAPPAAPPIEPPATQAYEPPPTEVFGFFAPLDPAIEGVTEALSPHPVGLPDPVDEGLESSAIDSLFGETAFVEYHEQPLFTGPPPRETPPPAGPGQELVVVPHAPKAPRAPIPRTQKILMWVAGGLAAALALIALFVLGTRMSSLFPAPAVVASPSPSPTVPAAPVVGPVEPGTYYWDRLLGGECLDPFDSAWQDRFTVVDCTAPHAGQLLVRGTFDDASNEAYPGVEGLQSRMALLCSAPTIVDYAVAGTVADLQITASYAADSADWNDGNREYFCFANRSSGQPLTGSVVLPQSAPVPTETPAP